MNEEKNLSFRIPKEAIDKMAVDKQWHEFSVTWSPTLIQIHIDGNLIYKKGE
jgi:hypothetical protein